MLAGAAMICRLSGGPGGKKPCRRQEEPGAPAGPPPAVPFPEAGPGVADAFPAQDTERTKVRIAGLFHTLEK